MLLSPDIYFWQNSNMITSKEEKIKRIFHDFYVFIVWVGCQLYYIISCQIYQFLLTMKLLNVFQNFKLSSSDSSSWTRVQIGGRLNTTCHRNTQSRSNFRDVNSLSIIYQCSDLRETIKILIYSLINWKQVG